MFCLHRKSLNGVYIYEYVKFKDEWSWKKIFHVGPTLKGSDSLLGYKTIVFSKLVLATWMSGLTHKPYCATIRCVARDKLTKCPRILSTQLDQNRWQLKPWPIYQEIQVTSQLAQAAMWPDQFQSLHHDITKTVNCDYKSHWTATASWREISQSIEIENNWFGQRRWVLKKIFSRKCQSVLCSYCHD